MIAIALPVPRLLDTDAMRSNPHEAYQTSGDELLPLAPCLAGDRLLTVGEAETESPD